MHCLECGDLSGLCAHDKPGEATKPSKNTYHSAPLAEAPKKRIEVACVDSLSGVEVVLRNTRTGESTCIVVVHEHGISRPRLVNPNLIATDDKSRVAIAD